MVNIKNHHFVKSLWGYPKTMVSTARPIALEHLYYEHDAMFLFRIIFKSPCLSPIRSPDIQSQVKRLSVQRRVTPFRGSLAVPAICRAAAGCKPPNRSILNCP